MLVVVAVGSALLLIFVKHLAAHFLFGIGVFALFLVVAGVLARKRLNQLQAVAPETATMSSASSSLSPGAGHADSSFDHLLVSRRPRPLKMKPTAYVLAVSLILALVGFSAPVFFLIRTSQWNPHAANGLPNLLSFGLLGLILLIALFASTRLLVRDRRLLSEGEVAIAVVNAQSFTGGENKSSKITYEFKDIAGRTCTGSGTDQTRTLFEDMRTPVFYDSRQTRVTTSPWSAQCSSWSSPSAYREAAQTSARCASAKIPRPSRLSVRLYAPRR